MGNTVSRRTLSVGQEHETLIALEAVGYNDNDAKALIESPGHELAKIALTAIRRRGIPLSTDERVVRAVMGPKHFWGTDNWTERPYNVSLSKKDLGKISSFPLSENILNGPCPFYPDKVMRDTHFVYATVERVGGVPFDLAAVHGIHNGASHPRVYTDWQNTHDFAKQPCILTWHVALINAVPGSTNLPYDERVRRLPPEYKPPKAVDRVLFEILYHKLNSVYPDQDIWVAVDDTDNGGSRVYLRCDPGGGVGVGVFGDRVNPYVGIAAEWKFSLILDS